MENSGISNNFYDLLIVIQNLKNSITNLQKEVKQLEKKSNKKDKNFRT